jgi:orotate phosphoribosyltransferase-like protein
MTAPISAARVAKMYRRGMSTTDIAADLHISTETVRRRLIEANEPRRPDAPTLRKMRAAKRRLDARGSSLGAAP